ncbi:apolipoprotein N-acyltransferase [Brevundimonas aurifodinae]|uniref:Apolipoprotein N-acyltransferase n=2 Tax=Brevundimonas TaxID=41275 RepID=A0ABV1NID0_9CAUL|nr:MAG: apolipoprotein N-acyltransferase [Brevundimonas sp. 12-68-7]OYX35755.1 MAG: apolipoprotein N-acyltransferase [Brevundimonas subvibrioides]
MTAFQERISALTAGRWARVVLALVAGVLAALVHPPFGFLPGLVAYPLLMLLAERSDSVRGAFWIGWLAGFGYFLVSCWWVAEAFLVNPAQAWMAPFAASLLPAGIGLFWGAAAALYRRFGPQGLSRVMVFAALFALLEWLRGHVLTGFPWNPAGAGWAAGSAASQFASVAGVYGLGLVTVAAACAFGPMVSTGPRKGRVGVALAGAAVFALLIVGGTVRLAGAQVRETPTVVRIVQANVDQQSKWTPEAYRSIVDRYVNLTGQAGATVPDLIIWPEGALPASFDTVFAPGSPDGAAIANALLPGQTLLAGFARGEGDAGGGARYYNSLIALEDEGGSGLRIAAIYDKHRLVPFGEFLPLGGLMGALGIRSLVHMPADFSAGPTPAPIDLPDGSRVQPLICYESLYPGFTPAGRGRPEWIVNVSNDAWFGATSGPIQHLNLASYRAIETGLPVVRATPTGVSAVIDPWGRVIEGQRLDSGESGVIDARLPAPAEVTLFGRIGHLSFWLMVLAGLAPLVRSFRGRWTAG